MSETNTSPTLQPWGDEDEAAWQERHGGRLVLPPSDDGLEMRLLGMLLINDVKLPKELSLWEFVDPAHRAIYGAMVECQTAGEPVTLQKVAARLDDEVRIAEVGGTTYLAKLVAAAQEPNAPPIQIESAAEMISELAHARHLLTYIAEMRGLIQVFEELVHEPGSHAPGAGRSKAHALAMDLTRLARDVLDRSLGWA